MAQETSKALEQLRQRLNTLAAQLGSLRQDLEASDPLPSWPSIQNSSNLLSQNLVSLQATLNATGPLLRSAHAYPLPSFPGRSHQDLLGQLLRKKLQPPVEDWIERGIALGQGVSPDNDELWSWAGPEGNRIAREVGEEAFADVFTLAEQGEGIENVPTGLRRRFWESDDDEDEAIEVDVADRRPEVIKKLDRHAGDSTLPSMGIEAILRFMVSGAMPAGAARS